ncbi:MAG: ACP S-malonyltransferase [Endomicrobiaceae bacterium]|nr:ACP S-malonyltransferase [Endomicrobiaceae bacterium]MDD3922847.1 ACP S-malonyltransferase [Endomicrobiaceae bacterium]
MKKILLMFPGQGSQYIGMGKDLYEKFPVAKNIIDQVGEEIKNIIFNGPEESLKNTKYAQPAIFAVSVATFEVLKNSIDLSKYEIMTAGHSLGEYSALCAAGFFNFQDGLSMVKARGEYIQQASQENPGGMAAILGMEKDVVINICKEASKIGICEPVNFNSPGQIVISGSNNAVQKAVDLAQAQGATKAIMLNVSGPFHSTLMKKAAEMMSEELNKYTFSNPQYSIITNCDAEVTRDATLIKEKLVKQIYNSVQWDTSISNAINCGVELFIEIGPQRILAGLMRRIDRTKKPLNIEDSISLEKVIGEISK